MQEHGPPPHAPLGRSLLLGGAVIGFAMRAAVILYLITVLVLWLRDDYCQSLANATDNAACALYC
jgi:hypothetical protein